jgi:hypothetical protein
MSATSVAMLPQPTPLPAKLFTLSAAAEIVSSVKAASEICCQVTLAYGATHSCCIRNGRLTPKLTSASRRRLLFVNKKKQKNFD